MEEIKQFLDDEGRLTQFPVKRKKKIIALFYLAEKFEKDRIYSEPEINEILNRWHTFCDPATLRREMLGIQLMSRTNDCRQYKLADPMPERDTVIKEQCI